jgi:hypothetical protein
VQEQIRSMLQMKAPPQPKRHSHARTSEKARSGAPFLFTLYAESEIQTS